MEKNMEAAVFSGRMQGRLWGFILPLDIQAEGAKSFAVLLNEIAWPFARIPKPETQQKICISLPWTRTQILNVESHNSTSTPDSKAPNTTY